MPDQACRCRERARAPGLLLGFEHLTFYANGPVAWIEEVFVRGQHRGYGVEESAIYHRKILDAQARQ